MKNLFKIIKTKFVGEMELHSKPIFGESVKSMSECELKETLELVKEWLEESQEDEVPEVHRKNLKKLHNREIEIIQAEIDKRTNCRIEGTN